MYLWDLGETTFEGRVKKKAVSPNPTETEIEEERWRANIVRFRAYYYAKEEKLLVYDYLPNGSLHALLHGMPNSLNPSNDSTYGS